MNIDPLQILQVTIYSKIINEVSNNINSRYMSLIICLFIALKIYENDYFQDKVSSYLMNMKDRGNSFIIIPYHKKRVMTWVSGGSKETTQIFYSNRFHALNHYLQKHYKRMINKTIEVEKREFKSSYYNETMDFTQLPIEGQKIKICEVNNIYFEIIIQQDNEYDDKDDKNKRTSSNSKNFTYKVSVDGIDKYHILTDFFDRCEEEFENDILNKNDNLIFEYLKSERDDEDNKCKLVYREHPFKSNKHLDKNVFFEGRDEFIKYIDKFAVHTGREMKSVHELEYEDSGITFKAGIILHGHPGCGKSCTIRGILNRTGRKGVILRWSLFKSCSEFCAAFRSGNINGKKYQLKDLCFIIEDFDANHDEVLKKRSSVKSEENTLDADSDSEPEPEEKNKTHKSESKKYLQNIQTAIKNMSKRDDDELTLDCVLNVMDGIIELHDAMFIFTTNHLEKIDPAFMRPGRIDYILELKRASVKTIREMIEYKYRKSSIDFHQYQDYFDKMKSDVITPALVQNIYLKYGENEIEKCLQELVIQTNP